MEDNKLPR